MVPPRLVEQTRRLYADLSQHWRLVEPNIISYGALSSPHRSGVLEASNPDALIFDEAHRAASATSATNKKIRRCIAERPGMPVVVLSGTVLKRRLTDYAGLMGWTLGGGSPAPRDYTTRRDWGMALDDLGALPNSAPGVLTKWCRDGETVREGYRRRLYDTPGVVGSSRLECDASLTLREWRPKVPANVEAALVALRRDWARPDGETFKEALDLYRHARSVAQGFYLRWTQTPPREWLDARRDWHSTVRKATARGRRGLESPALYEKAIEEGRQPRPATLDAWEAVRGVFVPKTEVVWISDYYLEAAASWAAKNGPALLWCDAPALGHRLAKLSGLTYYGQGAEADRELADEIEDAPGKRALILSMDAHAEGKNLQGWGRGLILAPPSSAKACEQLLARQHRGDVEEVEMSIAMHTLELREAVADAQRNARFVEEQEGQPQRLLAASWVAPVDSVAPPIQ